jgi:organic radical activating enzyme
MPIGTASTEADSVAETVQLYKTYEELPLVNTGCDSYASWHPKFKHLSPTYETSEVISKMLALTPNNRWVQDNGNDVHLVITGGEPLLGWQRVYPEMLEAIEMRDLKNITFETNGTQELSAEFKEYLREWVGISSITGREVTFSVSAKLSPSGEKWSDAIKPEVVVDYQTIGKTYLKFVVENPKDFEEVKAAVAEYRSEGFEGVVYVMPVGGVVTVYDGNKFNIADEAMLRGYYYSPRLHVDLWGNSWGK